MDIFHQTINITQIISTTFIMFAIIDILGSVPVLMDFISRKIIFKPLKSCLFSAFLYVMFFFLGDAILGMFKVDVPSFAVAGSIVIFILALEMILGIEIIKTEGNTQDATFFPVAFPLIAGPGGLTTFLSLRAEYSVINIFIGLLVNMLVVYLVLKYIYDINKYISQSVLSILRRFFGVILLAISIKMFITNILIILK